MEWKNGQRRPCRFFKILYQVRLFATDSGNDRESTAKGTENET